MVGARITGTFDLAQYEVKGKLRHEMIQQLLFHMTRLYSVVKTVKKENKNDMFDKGKNDQIESQLKAQEDRRPHNVEKDSQAQKKRKP